MVERNHHVRDKGNVTLENKDEQVKNDPAYLKEYVRKHPDNKMAWYLLGRSYAARGEHGKAQYCFQQAGEIYEAYEENQLQGAEPEDALTAGNGRRTEGAGTDKASEKRRKRPLGMMLRGVTGLLLLATVILLPSEWERWRKADGSPEWGGPDMAAVEDVSVGELKQAGDEGKAVPPVMAEYAVFYDGGDRRKQENLVSQVLLPGLGRAQAKLAVLLAGRPTEDGRHIAWGLGPTVVLSADRAPGGAQAAVRYHDADSCVCEPAPPGPAEAVAAQWQAEQEQDLVLRSALAAYRQRHRAGPAEPGALAAGYPNNWLPGLTPFMRERFAALAHDGSPFGEPASGGPAGAATPSPQGTAPAVTDIAFEPVPELEEPLRIIIDLDSHRLALISGSMMIRSYPVGIGAPKTPTPEGEFEITEKVKNPNGRSDGDFGSRGMTLSDTLYAIHGTNKPSSIEKDESLGCIRMLKEDVEELFDMVTFGTKVSIGRGGLTEDIIRPTQPYQPFQLPAESNETNPNKRYRWLD
jgi:lipoprotein-anchoring transpeptidase ErfK/SrfK